MAKVYVTQAASTGGSGGGNLQLLNGAAMDATLRAVADTANTASPLKLSTGGVQTTTKLQITTADTNYIDAEDNSGNNRFTVGRDPASQQVNVDFASNPGGSTELVGGFRTYVDGTNLSNVVNIRRDGQLQIGSTAASAMYWDNTNNRVGIGTATPGVKLDVHSGADNIAQLNRTGAGKSLLQYLLTGTARWATGFDNTNGNYTIYDAVNATDRVVVTNTGRLGVGTSAPTRPLTVVGSTNDIVAQIDALSNAYNTQLQLRTYSSNSAELLITGNIGTTPLNVGTIGGNTAIGLTLSALGSNNIQFYTTNSLLPRFRINNDGNIGAGTTAPTAKLQINGSGSTSATTSLLVQNSAGTDLFKVFDDGQIYVPQPGGQTMFIDTIKGYANSYVGCRSGFSCGSNIPSIVASAALQVNSTTQGFLPPRMTNAQRLAIATPDVGLMVYCTDAVEGLYVYKSTGWTFVI